MAKDQRKSLPQLGSLDDLVKFFDEHDLGEYVDQIPEATFDVDLKRKTSKRVFDAEIDKMEVRSMASQPTLEELEQQVAQLPLNEQLKLMAHIAEQLSSMPLDVFKEEDTISQQREREADAILALCDAAAEMWDGEFDADRAFYDAVSSDLSFVKYLSDYPESP